MTTNTAMLVQPLTDEREERRMLNMLKDPAKRAECGSYNMKPNDIG